MLLGPLQRQDKEKDCIIQACRLEFALKLWAVCFCDYVWFVVYGELGFAVWYCSSHIAGGGLIACYSLAGGPAG